MTWFHSPPSTQIGIYRSLFPLGTTETSYMVALNDMQKTSEEGKTWAMFMVAGGHFAGAIIQVSRPDGEEDDQPTNKKKKSKQQKPDTEVLKHKTFHRYTSECLLFICFEISSIQPAGSREALNLSMTMQKGMQRVLVLCSVDTANRH